MKTGIFKLFLTLAIITSFLMFLPILTHAADTDEVLTIGVYNGKASVISCSQEAAGEIVVPETYESYPVSEITTSAFAYCSSITKIVLPDTIKYIDNNAFEDCESLEEINIPSGVTAIRSNTFNGCRSLKKIELPETLTAIDAYAFGECESLEEINIPSGVTDIRAGAFYSCSSLRKIQLPESLKTIGAHVFEFCYQMESISIPEGVAIIEDNAFRYCEALTSIVMPRSLEEVGDNAFDYCYELKTVIFSDGIKTLGTGIFNHCENLEGIYIPQYIYEKFQERGCFGANDAQFYNAYIVTFMLDDKTYCVQTVGENLPVDLPVSPEGYKFIYYINGVEWNGESITEDTVIEMEIVNIYTVTYIGDYEAVDTVLHDSDVTLPEPPENYEYIFTVNGLSWNGENMDNKNITVEVKKIPILLGTIRAEADDSAIIGKTNYVTSFYMASEYEASYLVCHIKCPSFFTYVFPVAKDFKYVSLDSITPIDDQYQLISVTCQYDSVDKCPANTHLNPFDLEVDISDKAVAGDYIIEITDDTFLYGDELYKFENYIHHDFTIEGTMTQSLTIGGTSTVNAPYQFTAIFVPEYATNQQVIWSVDDETVATIDQNGVLTPLKKGTVVITAATTDGSGISATKTVYVSIRATIESITSNIGKWNVEYDPDIIRYVLFVPTNTVSIDFTARFSTGVVTDYLNNSIMINGMPKTITLDTEAPVAAFRISNVEGLDTNTYIVEIVRTDSPINAVYESSSKMRIFDITIDEGIVNEECTLIVALYNASDELTAVESKNIEAGTVKTTIAFEASSHYRHKIMLWGNKSLKPICIPFENQ